MTDKRPVTMGALVSGNVISIPRQRDKDGNPIKWEPGAVIYTETRYRDNNAHDTYGVIVLEGGEELEDPYPEIPKWNVIDNGVPFEAIYDDKPNAHERVKYRRKVNTDDPKVK